MVKKIIWSLIFMAAVFAIFITAYRADWIVDPYIPKVSALSSDKSDGDCQPTDTAGRCADKCPLGQYLQGFDKNTGAAICIPDSQTDPSETQQPATPIEQAPINPEPTFQGK